MFEVKYDPAFKEDFRRVVRRSPQILPEFKEAVDELVAHGRLPEEYNPHVLTNPGGNYNGNIEFHLAEGKFDVLVLYMPHKTNPSIRLVRMGSHDELF